MSEKERRRSWRLAFAAALGLLILSTLIGWLLSGCSSTPMPDVSPVQVQAVGLEEIPNAAGYFEFKMWGTSQPVTVTLYITQELRLAGVVLSERATSRTVVVDEILADTIAVPGYPLWPWYDVSPPMTGLQEWGLMSLQGQRPYTRIRHGVWYSDLDTPTTPGADGMYMIREVPVYKLFFPIMR